jgi:ubiquinone/menaquinone biosynthesis C-methylase UbiE
MCANKLTDPEYLRRRQYRTHANIEARIALHERFSVNPYPWRRWTFDQLDFPAGARILELGCGPGDLWLENANRVQGDWHHLLTDLSYGMVAEARRKLKGMDFTFGTANTLAIPFPEASFEAVLANHMLYHLPDRTKGLAEIRRVLKPGGWLYATTIGHQHMRALADLVNAFDPAIDYQRPGFSFSLENGHEQLTEWFDNVELRHYHNALEITAVEPLITYLRSIANFPWDRLPKNRLPELAEFLNGILKEQGVIRIEKAEGMFLAQKPGI